MRERGRRAAEAEDRRDRPFTPPRQGPSLLVMVLFWVSVAFLLYRGFEWLQARPKAYRPAPREVVVTNVPRYEQPAQAAPPQRFAPPEPADRSVPPRRIENVLPATRSQPAEERRREASPPPTSSTIYLCRAYNGGTFWAQAHCAQHQALIDSIVPVPAGLPFEQQVQLAEQRRQPTASTVHNTTINVSGPSAAAANGECKMLDARVEQLDAMARQPQSAQMQDWIRAQRQGARDRQFSLHC